MNCDREGCNGLAQMELLLLTLKSFAFRLIILAILHPALVAWSQVAIRVSDEVLDVQDVTYADGSFWLATTKGAYKVQGISTIPLSVGNLIPEERLDHPIPELLNVKRIVSGTNELWLCTDSGAYRIVGAHYVNRFPKSPVDIFSCGATNDGKIWFTSDEGAFVFDGHAMRQLGFFDGQATRPLGSGENPVRDVVPIGNDAWFVSNTGAYRANSDGSIQRFATSIPVNDITSIDGSVWIATDKGAYRVAGNDHVDVFRPDLNITRILTANGDVWLASTNGAYRITNTGVEAVPTASMAIVDVVQMGGTEWLATNRGLFRGHDGVFVSSPELAGPIKSIQNFNGNVWVGTYFGSFFLMKDGRFSRIPNIDSEVRKISLLHNVLWIVTNRGAFKATDAEIEIQALSADSYWKRLFEQVSPWPVFVEGVVSVAAKYVPITGSNTDSIDANPQFQAVVKQLQAGSSCGNIAEKFADEYSGVNHNFAKLSRGRSTLCVGVKDRSGNTAQRSQEVWVIPGPSTVLVITGLFWFGLLALLVALAPSSGFINDLLMNPWLRTLGSLWLIPLAMTIFPPVRRHMLKRYVANIANEREFLDVAERYEIPDEQFEPVQFGKRLSQRRVLQLTGQSGIGKTSYLRFLTATYALQLVARHADRSLGTDNAHGDWGGTKDESQLTKRVNLPNSQAIPPSRSIPVFVPLGRYNGQKVEDMVAAQLDSYGRLSDRQIVSWYIKAGEFLFFIDGLNEVDESTRNQVNSFIEENRRRSRFCISSQATYSQFTWIDEIRLTFLSDDNIKHIIYARLPPEQASNALAQFSRETFEVYKLPQDLEFLLQLLGGSDNVHIPQSKSELYHSVLAPIFADWRIQGQSGLQDQLTSRAYEMVEERDAHVNLPNTQPVEELTGPLLRRRLLTRRDTGFYFQHNLVRDYLASLHLSLNWREQLKEDNVKIDSDWTEVLRFVLERLKEPMDCKEFLYLVFDKNTTVAGVLFAWLESSRPNLADEWAAEFKLKVANAVLRTS
jgi:ligand-binding sensor domain-containing protein